MNFLFLYTELADYFLHCCSQLSAHGTVHILRWPVNKEAPFKFQFPENIKVYDKNKYTTDQLKKLIADIDPTIIFCSGWIDKDYLKLVKPYYKKIPTVLTCDTHWNGSLKQRFATILSRLFLLDKFSHAWVPGKPQFTYVQKLGFKPEKIRTEYYCCDLPKFNAFYEKEFSQKRTSFPKRFIYVGRYYNFKGVADLWEAFIKVQTEFPNEWELWCLGKGDIDPISHPKIKHFGFVQPQDLQPILAQSGVFVLPSRFEPWGVVVQEYAASGFPLLLSKNVGAAEVFLKEARNGYSFKAENVKEMADLLKKIIHLSNEELIKMAEESHTLAQNINPQSWKQTILDIINEQHKK
jgi:glycosyltransferase involved in cell wall biosynthesis